MSNYKLVHTTSISELLGHGSTSLALSPDGQMLAIGGDFGEVYLCSIDALDQVIALPYPWEEYGGVTSVAFSPDGSLLASVTHNGVIHIWDMKQNRLHARWESRNEEYAPEGILRPHLSIQVLLFSHNGTQLFGGGVGGIYKWDVQNGQELQHISTEQEYILALACDSSGRYLASGGWKNYVGLWDITTGAGHRYLSPQTERVDAVIFSPHDAYFVSGGSGQDGGIEEDKPTENLHIWNIEPFEQQESIQTPARWIQSLAWHSDQRVLAIGECYHRIVLWDSTTRKILQTLRSECRFVEWVQFHPYKPWLLSAGATTDHAETRLEIWQQM